MNTHHIPAPVRDAGAMEMNKTLSLRLGPGSGETKVITNEYLHCAVEFAI